MEPSEKHKMLLELLKSLTTEEDLIISIMLMMKEEKHLNQLMKYIIKEKNNLTIEKITKQAMEITTE